MNSKSFNQPRSPHNSAEMTPRLMPHPTCRGAVTWESIVAKVCFDKGINMHARDAVASGAGALQRRERIRAEMAREDGAPWDLVIARISEEGAASNTARGRAKRE